ncbi:hypothetical protein GE09DRAFT_1211781 [Coniochaeta sp. 2T2.1]|nr:hypothetical protein GE09DRAFT_1211781 [Coniochaeta sp. 2T2.1]
MSRNSSHIGEELPRYQNRSQLRRYPAAPTNPPSYKEDCKNRLAQIDSKIDAVGEKKLDQIEATYEGQTKKTLDQLREQIKELNKTLPGILKRPDESDRDRVHRLKHQNLTIEDYRRSITT